MKRNLNINVHHLTRVEGHGNIVVNMKEGKLEKSHLAIVEPPRFFEAMLKGRSFHEAAVITSRICGICSLGHQMTSLKATEAALGLEVSKQTILLRKLLTDGGTMQSNTLHSLFLAAPDFVNQPSVFAMIGDNTETVLRALRMKNIANEISEVIGGRAVHPITPVPGGFTRIPTVSELKKLRKRLVEEAIPDCKAIVDTMVALHDTIPNFTRDTEYISLQCDDEYALYDGDICSSDIGRVPVNEYRRMTNEYIVTHSTSKHSKANRESFMVGALARFNNNYSKLRGNARNSAEKMGLKAPCCNPYMNTIAQIVEVYHCTEDAIEIIDTLLAKGLKVEKPNQEPTKHGQGIGSTEVPRGILYHDYTYDRRGNIIRANCVIPTSQNLGNVDDDMEKLVPEIIEESKESIVHKLEMLVRAYDPCISCSVHLLDVEFIE
ncbi:MAG: Ni/Fe hydrogenase subunit alpha [Candidatus Neomarinimicrobiota bacterium]|nr:MAG: Ni/Fe hydrogenase subunit alpha [Candidatus Neomarinimicrobiota bacterium]